MQYNKGYAFDIDDNLLHTDLRVYVEKRRVIRTANGIEQVWDEIEISDKELKGCLADSENYRYPQNSPERCYRGLRKVGQMKKDLLDAFEAGRLGPSWESFKQANLSAAPIAWITARGNAVEDLIDSYKGLIYEAFTEEEREQLYENVYQQLQYRVGYVKQQLIDQFIAHNYYAPCSNVAYANMLKFPHEMGVPERKVLAFEQFIHHMKKHPAYRKNLATKLGFSDDMVENVLEMQKAIGHRLINKYPSIQFTIFNTSNPKVFEKTDYKRIGMIEE